MTVRICRRCHAQVQSSQVEGYRYYCPECDEDLFEFEIDTIKEDS